jgi:hypothetical protein
MSVVFDEVVATVAPEPMNKEEAPSGQSSEESQTGHVRQEVARLEQRMARLRAD